MKINHMILFGVAFAVSSTTMASQSSATLYEKLYRVAEKLYYVEYSLTTEQQNAIEALSNQMEWVLSNSDSETCGNKLSVFKESSKWAYSSAGLDLTSSEAEKFAMDVSNKFCPATYFKTFQLAYNFAYKRDGMDKTRIGARTVATQISDYESNTFYTKNALQCFIEGYQYAYSRSGLDRTKAESEAYAIKLCLG